MNPVIAFRNTVGIGLSLGIGFLLGSPTLALICSIGALITAFADGEDAYLIRAQRMLVCSLICGAALLAGLLCAAHLWLASGVAVLWGFVTGFMVLFGVTFSDLALFGLVMFLLFSAQSVPLGSAFEMAGTVFLGGVVQMVLSLVQWPFRPHRPEIRSLSRLLDGVARYALSTENLDSSPPLSLQSTQAQLAFSFLYRVESLEAERCRALLNQSERIRLSLLSLARLKKRLERTPQLAATAAHLEGYKLQVCAVLEDCARILRESSRAPREVAGLAELEALLALLRTEEESRGDFAGAVLRDTWMQASALAGQIRAVAKLVRLEVRHGILTAEDLKKRPWELRPRNLWSSIKANLSFQSAACRHAVRLSVGIAIGELLTHLLHLPRAQWLPMTLVIVLKPDLTATFSRGFLRILGTLLGLILATMLFKLLAPGLETEFVLLLMFMFVLRWVGPINYGVFTIAVSGLVVVIVAMTHVDPIEVIWARGWNTLLGGAIALLLYLLWPTWEKNQVSDIVAQMLESYKNYFVLVSKSLQVDSSVSDKELENARVLGRIARGNFEASLGRYEAEPGMEEKKILLRGIQSSSNRFAYAVMSLEATLATTRAGADPNLGIFRQQVILFLDAVIAGLQGAEMRRLPNLREVYISLWPPKMDSEGNVVEAEADSMTNSLNTLGEQAAKWLQLQPKRS